MPENNTGKILAILGGTGILGTLAYFLLKKKEPAPPAKEIPEEEIPEEEICAEITDVKM